MRLSESLEDYLETILVLQCKKGAENVRSIDIARHMNYSKPSVSNAVKALRNKGCLEMDQGGFLHLTETGNTLAARVYERHLFLSKVLIVAGVSEDIAVKDACRIEHYISDESFEKIKSTWNHAAVEIP